MATTNVHKFTADIEKFVNKIGVQKKLVVQKIALDLWTGITKRTPVRTGRARANWMLSVGAPAGDILHADAKEPNSVPEPPRPAVGEITGEESVWIVNNLPYISALEDGSSTQAPQGMVGLAMQATAATIDRVIGEATK